MPEGRRYSPDNPSPAMQDFAQYIRDHGYPNVTDEAVAATSMFHKEWQRQHAERVREERKVTNAEKEKERAAKEEKREADKKARAEKKAADEAAKEEKRKQREADKAAKDAEKADTGADGDDSDSAPADGESGGPRKRLRVRGDAAEATAGASAGQF
jgi:hypothetical protein